MKKGKTLLIHCPFCEGVVILGVGESSAYVGHTEPACSKFLADGPDAFIQHVCEVRVPETKGMTDKQLEAFIAKHSPN